MIIVSVEILKRGVSKDVAPEIMPKCSIISILISKHVTVFTKFTNKRIKSAHERDYEEDCDPRYDVVQFGRNLQKYHLRLEIKIC
jgi:hypothetical protein